MELHSSPTLIAPSGASSLLNQTSFTSIIFVIINHRFYLFLANCPLNIYFVKQALIVFLGLCIVTYIFHFCSFGTSLFIRGLILGRAIHICIQCSSRERWFWPQLQTGAVQNKVLL
ncbi:Hypothetical_protein [Hexamita inflata]|uniref:Hypothetical_protein n=1 Tax=Hexamita inflata TaxID=28002 RepID=A0ABP1HC93_9EUKA